MLYKIFTPAETVFIGLFFHFYFLAKLLRRDIGFRNKYGFSIHIISALVAAWIAFFVKLYYR